MDPECVDLCDALNGLPGFQTSESCCGHGNRPYVIFFSCTAFAALKRLAEAIHDKPWRIEAMWWSGSNTLGFMLQGPTMRVVGSGVRESWLIDLIETVLSGTR